MEDFILRNWPSNIEEVVLGNKQLRVQLTSIVTSDSDTHILLVGNAGIGKLTIATSLIRKERGVIHYLIECNEKVMDKVEINYLNSITKNRLSSFTEKESDGIFNSIDLFKGDDQQRVADGMETIIDLPKKGVLTACALKNVNPDIISQCKVIHVTPPSNECWIPRIQQILVNEGFEELSDNACLSIIRTGKGTAKGILRELYLLCERFK